MGPVYTTGMRPLSEHESTVNTGTDLPDFRLYFLCPNPQHLRRPRHIARASKLLTELSAVVAAPEPQVAFIAVGNRVVVCGCDAYNDVLLESFHQHRDCAADHLVRTHTQLAVLVAAPAIQISITTDGEAVIFCDCNLRDDYSTKRLDDLRRWDGGVIAMAKTTIFPMAP